MSTVGGAANRNPTTSPNTKAKSAIKTIAQGINDKKAQKTETSPEVITQDGGLAAYTLGIATGDTTADRIVKQAASGGTTQDIQKWYQEKQRESQIAAQDYAMKQQNLALIGPAIGALGQLFGGLMGQGGAGGAVASAKKQQGNQDWENQGAQQG